MSVSRAGLTPLVLSSFVLAAALCGTTGAAQAQTPPAPAASPSPAAAPPAPPLRNIMIVNTQSLLEKSKAAVMVHQQLQQKGVEYEKEMRRQEQPLQQESETLQRQAASLSAEALSQKKRDFERKVGEFDRSVQAKREALQRSRAEASEKIETVVRDIIAEMAKEKNVDLVFSSTQLVMFSPAFDVTDAVLQKLDERLPSLTVSVVEQPVAAGNSAAPAQPASASAQPAPAPKKKK
jgi:Skp family chaperone for outer membrane proteins